MLDIRRLTYIISGTDRDDCAVVLQQFLESGQIIARASLEQLPFHIHAAAAAAAADDNDDDGM